ncbi:MAG TPA: TrbI/VirB10 family protein [Gemmatimonadaceae bacterium]|jgi:type IV secretory pathway VirB10-like protein|nr:TrbI/VirB10 family protein [Gemmatimonadaceae bacterium]
MRWMKWLPSVGDQSKGDAPLDERGLEKRAEALLRPSPPAAKRLNRNALTVVAVILGLTVIIALVMIRTGPASTTRGGTNESANSVTPAMPPSMFARPWTGTASVPPSTPLPFPSTSGSSPLRTPTNSALDSAVDSIARVNPYQREIRPPTTATPVPLASPRQEAYLRALKAPPVADAINGSDGTAGRMGRSPVNAPEGEVDSSGVDTNAARITPTPAQFENALESTNAPAASARPANGSPKGEYQTFLASAAVPKATDIHSSVEPAAARLLLQAGTVIPGVLITGVTSDLPGACLGQVSRDVYDSRTERVLLIPKGAKLLCKYDNEIVVGQDRLLVAWTRIIFPDGRSIALPGLGITDEQGSAGIHDQVDNHYRRVFGNALLLSVISAGTQLSQPSGTVGVYGVTPSARQVAAGAVGAELSDVATEMTRRNLAIQPTIKIRPGTPFNVFLNGDLAFTGAYVDER